MEEKTNLYCDYKSYLQERYGEKVYKLPVNLPGTCPNRDGTLGTGGCIFCDEEGAGFECLANTLSVKEQLNKNKEFFLKRFQARKFIAYFQTFTNTYLPLARFKQNILAACEEKDLVGIAISTRPDSILKEQLIFLQDVALEYNLDINIELGLQTVNYHTLEKINRGHTLAEFIDAVLSIQKFGFPVCAHLILNLPWDNELDVIENAKILSALKIDFVKLHSLYIVKNTALGQLYEEGKFSLISLDEYVQRVIVFLQYLSPEIVIQRLVGKGPQGNLYFSNWNTSWWKIKQQIEEEMQQKEIFQGQKFTYLGGKVFERNSAF